MGLKKSELILIVLSQRGCLTLPELMEKTGITDENLLLVYLTRMHKRGLLYRKWRHFNGKKLREYCLKKQIVPYHY